MGMDDGETQTGDGGGEQRGRVLQAGEVFEEYKVIRLLGRGGMGEVYEVEHRDLDTRHALKLIHPDIVGRVDSGERFAREAKVMAQLRHENIVHVDDFRQSGERAWLRMELVGGESLASVVKARGRLPEGQVREILRQVLEGLSYAHGKGVVHRDLKPANLLLEGDLHGGTDETEEELGKGFRVKIADFGLVRLAGEEWVQSQVKESVANSMSIGSAPTEVEASMGTSTKALLGTFAYMSPEQKRGEEADARSDLYALGLMAYQLLTGEESLGMKAPSRLNPELEPGWDAWMEKAVESKPEERFESAEAMFSAIPEEVGKVASGKVKGKKPTSTYRKHWAFKPGYNIPIMAILGFFLIGAFFYFEKAQTRTDGQAVPVKGSDWAVELAGGEVIELKWIDPGEFVMGSPENDLQAHIDEHPPTRVQLTAGYWLGKYEVTQEQWQSLMGNNPSHFQESGRQFPVEQVSWNDAMAFCSILTQQERASGRLPEGMAYTLPSEAQWEYACRAGTTSQFSFGNQDSDLQNYGNYADKNTSFDWSDKTGDDGYENTAPVGSFKPNPWGFYDMHGNVWEWCKDWFGTYTGGSVTDPVGPSSGTSRVYRSNGWKASAGGCRSAFRFGWSPDTARNDLGFRLALTGSS